MTSHGLIPQHPGPFGRVPKRNPGNHDWVSRDTLDISCQATGCTYNKGAKCMVPSLCKINDKGGCDGFKAKELPKQIDGD